MTRLQVIIAVLIVSTVGLGWTSLPVTSDRKLFMPGTQPGAANLESASKCDNCHGGYNAAVEPAYNWRGGMMAQAARDPLWLACLTVADQDSIWALGNPNAGDLCIRCHTPTGWLGGRSDPPNASALTASKGDFEGVSCDACHSMVDPFNALRQMPELPAETDPNAITLANNTYAVDHTFLQTLLLFGGSPFYNATTRLPVYFGSGHITNYSEAASGQYFVDTLNTSTKRGPRADANPSHQFFYSRFHKSKYFCATCHDVSNPALANVVHGAGVPERQAAASYFHVERTFSEFMLSAYGRQGGTNTNSKIAAAGVSWAAKCQDCHMRDVTGKACNKNVATRTDLALHDQTGGNAWISGILASADQGGPVYDAYNYAILSGTKYPGAKIDVAGLQGLGAALTNGQGRARRQLQMAADLVPISEATGEATIRIQNNTGHKLISGFPEGRRMWLSVKFYDATGAVIGEINPYTPLVISTNAQGNAVYVSGGELQKTRGDLVYEAKTKSSLTGEEESFHFVLATDRHKDNRIPPKGFDIAQAGARLATPQWDGNPATNYFTAAEYAGGYDEITFAKPPGATAWKAELYYQTTSKDYIEFLRNEINGTASTLTNPPPSGELQSYIVQTDPFFVSLKDWGNAIWDLWLHNGGAAPVKMTQLVGAPTITQMQHEPAGLRIRFGTAPSAAYRVQYKDDIHTGAWQELGTSVAGDGSVKEIVDPGAGSVTQRFYRVIASIAP